MAQIIGLMRLGRDAEIRYTASGEAVANLALAYNYGKKGEDGKQPSQWVDASLWGKRAEALAQYLTKGTALVVTLSDVHVRIYEKKDGGMGATLAGRIADVEFAGKPADQAQKPAPRVNANQPPPTARQQAERSAESAPFADDDIPF